MTAHANHFKVRTQFFHEIQNTSSNVLSRERTPYSRIHRCRETSSGLAVEYRWVTLAPSIFRAGFIRQVSYYTFLREWRLPWPSACCQNEPTTFWNLLSNHLGTLTQRSAYPASPVLLPKMAHLKEINKHTGVKTHPISILPRLTILQQSLVQYLIVNRLKHIVTRRSNNKFRFWHHLPH